MLLKFKFLFPIFTLLAFVKIGFSEPYESSLSTVVYESEIFLDSNGLPELPPSIPAGWLSKDLHPRVITNRAKLARAQQTISESEWGKDYISSITRGLAPFTRLSEDELRSLVPPEGSLFIAGRMGMDIDPINLRQLRWMGWGNPFQMQAVDGTIYPNESWPDTGNGVMCDETNVTYYFLAMANGQIAGRLTRDVLPRLGYAYALTGEMIYAQTAAILLDQLAVVYPESYRGPLDYPQGNRLETEESTQFWQARGIGGRLDLANYMVARHLILLVYVTDLIAPSGVLEKHSKASNGETIREHIIRNILWDSARFVYGGALHKDRLTNGLADYIRGSAAVGILLNIPAFVEPLISPEKGLSVMLDNNIDRDGLYWESAPGYEEFTRRLYLSMAELVEAMVWNENFGDVQSIYHHPKMIEFLTEPFNRREVGGQTPHTGDTAVLNTTVQPDNLGKGDRYRRSQYQSSWVLAARGEDEVREQAIELLARMYNAESLDPYPVGLGCPFTNYFFPFHIFSDLIDEVKDQQIEVTRAESRSIYYGAKGLAILRGGAGENRYGAQLSFGPMFVHGDEETLTWTFFARGSEWSMDPGHTNSHFRYGWTTPSISHQSIVINEKSFKTSEGGGFLRAWYAGDEVQVAMAAHQDAYKDEGVTRFERLIAQVHNSETGQLGYWLDLSRIEGGQIRDDSFHTQMKEIEVENLDLKSMGRASLGGDLDFSKSVRADYRIQGYEHKHFRWSPPGEGYNFLGSPQVAQMTEGARVIMRSPAFSPDNPSIITDLLGQFGRQIIVAQGPEVVGSAEELPSVPYVITRDKAGNESVFAKVIRLVDEDTSDPIETVRWLNLKEVEDSKINNLYRALEISWINGNVDIWMFADGSGNGHATLQDSSHGFFETDALVALIRLNSHGKLLNLKALDSSYFRYKNQNSMVLKGSPTLEGKVKEIDLQANSIRMEIDWIGEISHRKINRDYLAISVPKIGQPGTWRVSSIEGNTLILNGINPILAKGKLIQSDSDNRGTFTLSPPVSRFQSLFSGPLHDYAIGKAVFSDGAYLGRIKELINSRTSLIRILDSDGYPLEATERNVIISEIGVGDIIRIPGNIFWQSE